MRGPESTGHAYGVNVDVKCPSGTKPLVLWHTHPRSGSLHPSDADMKAARENNIPWLCVHIPENGALACYPVVGAK